MSRLPSAASSTSLTEELDKLEQSITLTLQEIDHNFSRAHAIVNSSILPIVEKYATHSNAVWEGSQFWKKIFEASANVSLSGVEEPIDQKENPISTQPSENIRKYASGSSSQSDDETAYSQKEEEPKRHDDADDSFMENADFTQSTPRAIKSNLEHGPSSEASKTDVKIASQRNWDEEINIPSIPDHRSKIPDASKTTLAPSSSLMIELPSPTHHKTSNDPILHRVLDKNYRLQATPFLTTQNRITPCNRTTWHEFESPVSSPATAPQLHSDLFSSPSRPRHGKPFMALTPGNSVRTPAKKIIKNQTPEISKKDEITWESDSEEDAEGIYRGLGLSPPKTIQFILPQSKILQTPAREASQRIVQDLLATAGAGFNPSDTEDSPSMVVRNETDYDF